jgi:Flp pilus assembly protein TadD
MTARATLALATLVAAGCAAHRASSPTVRLNVALAHSLAERGQKDAAFQAADAACREAPDDGAARSIRGALLTGRGLLDEAEADLKDAVRLEPDLAEAHSGLAVLDERRQRLAEAEAEHRRAAELAPRDARYLNNLGYALLVHGKPAEALLVLMQAARLDPLNARIRNNLGFAHARLSDFPRAAREFALGGSPAEAQNNLGFAYERAGNMAQARAHYEEALRLDASLAAARQNLARMSGAPRADANPSGGPAASNSDPGALANLARP